MNVNSSTTQQAERLLRLYPKAWRERYGPEFVDLMEQDFAETPRSVKRTSNIVVKAVGARFHDVGLTGSTLDRSNQSRAALATTFVAAVLFMALALHFWAEGMLNWNLLHRASTAVSMWLGAVTILSILLVAMVLAIFGWLIGSAIVKVATGKAKEIGGSLSLVVGTVAFLGWSVESAMQNVVARGGIQWTHPGEATKQLAGSVYAVTMTVIRVWLGPGQQLRSVSDLVYLLTPFALVLFALGAAALIRQRALYALSRRTGRVVTISFAIMMTLYLIGLMGWVVASGTGNTIFPTPMTSSSQFVELGAMVLMAVLAIQITRRLWLTTKQSPVK